MAVDNEDHAIDTLQHELARRVVEHLAGDGVDIESRLHTTKRTEVERQVVKEQGALTLCSDGCQLAFAAVRRLRVDNL